MTRSSIPAPIQILENNSERPLTGYPSARLPSIREMNLLESTRPHTSTLLTLADTSLTQAQYNHHSMINMRRLSVPNTMVPQRSGCDPVRGRPTINKTGNKSRVKPGNKSKPGKPNFNPGLFNYNLPQLIHNPTMYLNKDQHPAPWTHPGTLFPRLEPAPLSAPIRANGFQDHFNPPPSSTHLPHLSSPIDSTPSRHNSDPVSLNDSKVSHRLKEQQRRDSFSHGMKLLDEKLDQLEGAAPLPKRKKLDTIHLAYQKLTQQAQEIDFLKRQLTAAQLERFSRP